MSFITHIPTLPPTPPGPHRRRLPLVRSSITHKFRVGQEKGYLTVGLYEDGTPGELFIKMAKEGSTISGLLDTMGVLTSLALQHGVPLVVIFGKLQNMHFEPDGLTSNPNIPFAKSVVDYIARWVLDRFSSTSHPFSKK